MIQKSGGSQGFFHSEPGILPFRARDSSIQSQGFFHQQIGQFGAEKPQRIDSTKESLKGHRLEVLECKEWRFGAEMHRELLGLDGVVLDDLNFEG